MPNVDAIKIWDDYTNGTNYKNSENIYNITRRNERYYAGDQWRGVKSGDLNTLTFNFIEQLVDVKVSTLLSNKLTINRRADEMDEKDSKESELAKAIALMDKKNWERLKMDASNEEMLLKNALSGLGGSYWFWDNEIVTGNKFKAKGDFKAETIDAIDLYVSNPNNEKIQTQDWIILTFRKTVAQVRKMAKDLGMSDEEIAMIQGDEDTTYEGYDKSEIEQDGKNDNNNVTIILKLWKEDGKVYYSKTIKKMILVDKTDTELILYPVAMMNWKNRQKSIYGTGEPTYIIHNQQSTNKLASLRDASAQRMALPSLVYNKNMVSGVTNQPGRTYGLDLQANTGVGGMIQYLQPTSSSIDIDKSLDTNINLTKQLKGINDNVLGAARAENKSAIIAQQRAAGVPLESIKRRFWQYLEDVALIWLDFYQHKYNITRKLKDDEGNEISFKGTDAKDMYLRTSIDVGESTNWSEPIIVQVLDNWLEAGHITFTEYLERFPKNLIPDMDKLIQSREEQEKMPEQEEINEDELIAQAQQFIAQMPPDIQQMIQAMGEDALEHVQAMMQMDEQELSQHIEQMRGA